MNICVVSLNSNQFLKISETCLCFYCIKDVKEQRNVLKSTEMCVSSLFRLSGFMLPSPIVSSGSILALWFTTDFAVSAQGFKAIYEGKRKMCFSKMSCSCLFIIFIRRGYAGVFRRENLFYEWNVTRRHRNWPRSMLASIYAVNLHVELSCTCYSWGALPTRSNSHFRGEFQFIFVCFERSWHLYASTLNFTPSNVECSGADFRQQRPTGPFIVCRSWNPLPGVKGGDGTGRRWNWSAAALYKSTPPSSGQNLMRCFVCLPTSCCSVKVKWLWQCPLMDYWMR